jgi:hypothetical protein
MPLHDPLAVPHQLRRDESHGLAINCGLAINSCVLVLASCATTMLVSMKPPLNIKPSSSISQPITSRSLRPTGASVRDGSKHVPREHFAHSRKAGD